MMALACLEIGTYFRNIESEARCLHSLIGNHISNGTQTLAVPYRRLRVAPRN